MILAENRLLFEDGIGAAKPMTEQFMNLDLKKAYEKGFLLAEKHEQITTETLCGLSSTLMRNTGMLYKTIAGTFDSAAPGAKTLGEAVKMMIDGGIFNVGNGTWKIIGLVVALAIMAMGIGGGIEKANKIMMPLLFGLFLILGVYIAFLPGAGEGYRYIFTLNPKGLLNPEVWIFAFGQAFFSLSVVENPLLKSSSIDIPIEGISFLASTSKAFE